MGWIDNVQNRLVLTISEDLIDDTLVNFPVLIHLSDDCGLNNFNADEFFDLMSSDSNRDKIAVTTDDGIQCYVEIEKWSQSDKEAFMWAKIPVITSFKDTTLYLYYDPTTSGNTEYVSDTLGLAAFNVWDSNTKSVLHLNSTASGVTGEFYNSVNNNNYGSGRGVLTTKVDGKIGYGQSFSSSSDYIAINNADLPYGSYQYTYSFLMKCDDYSGQSRFVVSKGSESTNLGRHFWIEYTDGTIGISHWGNDHDTGVPITNDVWYHMAVTYDGNVERLFVNGEQSWSYVVGTLGVANTDIYLGRHHNYATLYFDGALDEYRESNIVRSSSWLKADYNSCFDQLFDISKESINYYFGYVTENSVPVSRRVLLYNRDTGLLMGETTSSGTNGYYYVTTTISGEHFIVVLDDDAGESYNALISDKLLPRGVV